MGVWGDCACVCVCDGADVGGGVDIGFGMGESVGDDVEVGAGVDTCAGEGVSDRLVLEEFAKVKMSLAMGKSWRETSIRPCKSVIVAGVGASIMRLMSSSATVSGRMPVDKRLLRVSIVSIISQVV